MIKILFFALVALLLLRPYQSGNIFCTSLKCSEWETFCKSGKLPENIPKYPDQTYKNDGWKGVADWLGNGYVNQSDRNYLSFKDAREFVYKLNLKKSRKSTFSIQSLIRLAALRCGIF